MAQWTGTRNKCVPDDTDTGKSMPCLFRRIPKIFRNLRHTSPLNVKMKLVVKNKVVYFNA